MRIIYGVNPVLEALNSHPEDFKDLLIVQGRAGQAGEKIKKLAHQHGIRCRIVGKDEIEKLAQTTHHQGVAGILTEFQYAEVEDILERWKSSGEKALLLILETLVHSSGQPMQQAFMASLSRKTGQQRSRLQLPRHLQEQ